MVVGNGKHQATNRDAQGRFPPGVSGNPAGRPPGVGCMSQLNAILDLEDGTLRYKLMQSLVAHASEGDMQAMRLILERTDPVVNVNVNHNVERSEMLDNLGRLRAKVANGKGAKPGSH